MPNPYRRKKLARAKRKEDEAKALVEKSTIEKKPESKKLEEPLVNFQKGKENRLKEEAEEKVTEKAKKVEKKEK